MIRSAVLRLTLWYLAIIMALSVGFSFFLYRVSADELNRGFHHQAVVYFTQFGIISPQPQREIELSEGRTHLRNDLLLFNLIILLIGGATSYVLARRTLHPIEEALDSQSRFTADASHELRTPLTAMQTEIEVALRDKQLTKGEAKQLLKSNLEEVAKLRALSDGLLRLARQDNQLLDGQADLRKVATAAISRARPLLAAKSMELQDQIPKVQVKGDEQSLIELMVVLLDNAIKYSDPSKKIILQAVAHSHHVDLKVIDEGYGIKAADLPHIFDRFYRSDASRSKKQTEGYGLGLSIAQKIADLHGGSIEVQSKLGQGTTFVVRLQSA